MPEDKIIDNIVEVIVREVSPRSIVLFGSRAKGTHGPDSDIDLLIVEDHDFTEENTRWGELKKIRRLLSDVPVSKDILVYSVNEINYWKDSINHVIPTCLKEGRVLYERS